MRKMLAVIVIGILMLLALIGSVLFGAESSNELPKKETSKTSEVDEASYSAADVANHGLEHDCWTIIDNEVYDLTTFIAEHPGGKVVVEACGVDATTAFQNQGLPVGQADEIREDLSIPLGEAFHSPAAREMLDNLKIGVLAE